jgi:hypothetical protein
MKYAPVDKYLESALIQDKTIAKPPFSEKGGGFWGVSGEIPNLRK